MREINVVNKDVVLGWFQQERTYGWMVEEYRREYGVATTPSFWGAFRRLHGLPLPVTGPNALIPCQVREEHRWDYPIMMLRTEARRRAGDDIDDDHLTKLIAWLEQMNRDQTVVHYAPDTDEGFVYTPKREGIDNDLIRVPGAESLPPV